MLRTNEDKLIITSMQAHTVPPHGARLYRVDNQGRPFWPHGTGGITYNIKVGDSVYGWAGDHIEPCVSSMADSKDGDSDLNISYNALTCVGNQARLITGDAKGQVGAVTGFHGACRVLVDFPDKALAKMTLDDQFLVRCVGQGLELPDYPDVFVYNLDPVLLHKMEIRERGGRIEIPVAAIVPGWLMGSGIGSSSPVTSDYDIMTQDPGQLKEHKLDALRLGDFVAIQDHDNRYGQCFRKGAVTIGIVTHADCHSGGHGPGVSTLLSARKPVLLPRRSAGANIARYLKIGRFRRR